MRTCAGIPHLGPRRGGRARRPVRFGMSVRGPNPPDRVMGRARQLCPRTSDVDFLGDLMRVVDLNAEVAYGAFDPMASWP